MGGKLLGKRTPEFLLAQSRGSLKLFLCLCVKCASYQVEMVTGGTLVEEVMELLRTYPGSTCEG